MENLLPESLPKDIEKYGDALIKAWEQYLKIIDILIALAGASALVIVNFLKEFGVSTLKTPFGIAAISSFGLALFCLAFWRFAAQHYFEYETIGSPKIAARYYEFHGISNPVTKAHINQEDSRELFRKAYKWLSVASVSLLAISWLSFICLLVKIS